MISAPSVLNASGIKADEVVQLVCEQMEGAHKLNVPLKVDVESGSNWEEMHEIEGH